MCLTASCGTRLHLPVVDWMNALALLVLFSIHQPLSLIVLGVHCADSADSIYDAARTMLLALNIPPEELRGLGIAVSGSLPFGLFCTAACLHFLRQQKRRRVLH